MIHMYLMHFKKCSHGKAFKNMMTDLNIRVTSDTNHYKVREGKSKFMQTLCTLGSNCT